MNSAKTITLCLLVCLGIFTASSVQAQQSETIQKKGYTLHFINQNPALNPTVKSRLIQTFFEVYPVLSNLYNKKAGKEVSFLVDTAYTGVAEASNGEVRFSATWLRDHPGDIDVVTHEVMHLVQNYPGDSGPGWITEGIADYVRYTYGVDNAGGGWYLPAYRPDQSYTNA
jgi:hypothetical protein